MIQMAHRPHRTPSAHEKTFLIAAVVLLMPAWEDVTSRATVFRP